MPTVMGKCYEQALNHAKEAIKGEKNAFEHRPYAKEEHLGGPRLDGNRDAQRSAVQAGCNLLQRRWRWPIGRHYHWV